MTDKEALRMAREVMRNQGDVGVDEWIAAEAAIEQALAAPVEPDWKAEYLKSVESGCITLDELREARVELDATNRQVEILSDALAESRREVAALKAVQEPAFKVSNLVTLTGGEYPGLGQWFVQLWDGDEVAARVYGDSREVINRRIAALNTPPAAKRKWVGLTVLEQADCFANTEDATEFYHAIEAKLKERNQ